MKLPILATLGMLLIAAPALAHDAKGRNGGRVADAGDHHVELVAKGSAVEVFLSDHGDKAVSPAGYKGLAILVIDGKSQRIVLTPQDNKLSGQASGSVGNQTKGVVQITTPGGKTAQARFN